MAKKNDKHAKSDHEADHDRVEQITEVGDIGDEQCPAGEIKADKAPWNYKAGKVKKDKPSDELKDFISSF